MCFGGFPLSLAPGSGASPTAPSGELSTTSGAGGGAGSGSLEGAVRHVRTFGPIQRAEVALCGDESKTVIEVDAPRDRTLQTGDIVGLQPRRYRIFAAQD